MSQAVLDKPKTAASSRPPMSAQEMELGELAAEVRVLLRSAAFWAGLGIKVACAMLFGSHFATRWFSPFLYDFVAGHFANPWTAYMAKGEAMAFPYGPGMLAVCSVPYLPAAFAQFDPSSHFGLFLLRVPSLAADLAILLLLMRWLRVHARHVLYAYWLSPIVLYAAYVHGQLDLVPTAILCVALHLIFVRRIAAGGAVFGLALATKMHLLVALPFVVLYLYRQRRPKLGWLKFSAITAAVAAALYAPALSSPAFRAMVLGSAESRKVWAVAIPYGPSGILLYVAPAALLVGLLRFASYRKLNREITMMYVGALYVGLVALVPPQPGWFIWSIPFVAYLGARFTRAGRSAIIALSSAYLAYFFLADTEVFLEAFDPLLGAGFGARSAASLAGAIPALGSHQTASVAWTLLFSATALSAFEMYRKGVRSNSVYQFRDDSFMIGIGGDSGAGKHTVGRDLQAVIGEQLSVINGDDDHKWERGHVMWRRYTHLDPRGNRLAAQSESLAALRRGGDVRKRHYDHDEGRFTSPLVIRPTEFVAIVGLHPFYLPSQRKLLHLLVFIDPDEDLRREWKVSRDMKKRGYSREQVIEQIERRMADGAKFVKPQVKYAHVVVRNHFPAPEGEEGVSMTFEIATHLEPLGLVDVLDGVDSLEVEWSPDDELTRDRVTVRGTLTKEQVRELVLALLPNADELVADDSAWMPGARGMTQAVLLHAMSMRLQAQLGGAEG